MMAERRVVTSQNGHPARVSGARMGAYFWAVTSLSIIPLTFLEIVDLGLCAQILHQSESSAAFRKPRDMTLRVIEIAKIESLARTGLHTGRDHLTLSDLLLLCHHLCTSNSLDAKVALLGDPFSPVVDIRVQSFFIFFGPGRFMPVEISNRIGTIGDAHSNPDATRINLGYNPFRILISCCYRTDLYAWWLITMHAGNGNKAHLHIGIGSLYFADEIHPELCSPKFGLFFSYKWNVIFLPARYHTGLTACAFI
jgi:hypothetical protein